MPKTLKKVLITGCSGFCGYWLIKHIRERFPGSILFGVDLTLNKNVNSILDNFYSLNLSDFKKTRELSITLNRKSYFISPGYSMMKMLKKYTRLMSAEL